MGYVKVIEFRLNARNVRWLPDVTPCRCGDPAYRARRRRQRLSSYRRIAALPVAFIANKTSMV